MWWFHLIDGTQCSGWLCLFSSELVGVDFRDLEIGSDYWKTELGTAIIRYFAMFVFLDLQAPFNSVDSALLWHCLFQEGMLNWFIFFLHFDMPKSSSCPSRSSFRFHHKKWRSSEFPSFTLALQFTDLNDYESGHVLTWEWFYWYLVRQ